jgi:hypothetical protein
VFLADTVCLALHLQHPNNLNHTSQPGSP